MRGRREYHVGIDAGSVSINALVIDGKRQIIHEAPYRRHLGKVPQKIRVLLEDLYDRFGQENIRSISFTGNHGKALSERLEVFYEFDTISQVLGTLHLRPDVRTIMSMGGQDTALFQIRPPVQRGHGHETSPSSSWELEYFNANGPCASGTGSFIDQQAQRLATALYAEKTDTSQAHLDHILKDFIALGEKSTRPASVACRCTVFTKSDMIHLQNRGERLEDIIYGLHLGNARNYISTIVTNRTLQEPILFIGGVSLNPLQVKAFQEYFPNLVVPPHSTSAGALGVALEALEAIEEKGQRQWARTISLDLLSHEERKGDLSVPSAPRLLLKETVFPEDNRIEVQSVEKRERAFLGVDIGSTTTKYALIHEDGKILYKNYVPTQGKPIEVTQFLLNDLKEAIGDRVEIAGVATTGSGRNVVGDFLNADLILDEITAHARGAVEIDPEVDTIFEIGGQDSKYIFIANTHPLDFDMNKVCAAGTGSFLHELANKYGINIVGEFQDVALSAEHPVKLAERCTVFMESDLVSYHQKGVDQNNLMGGLCYAIVYNYLNRVVEKRKVGQRVMFLGGPSLNKGVVAAFENVLGRPLLVPKHREVLGAYGAALSVREQMLATNPQKSRFRGLESAIQDRMDFKEKTCQADPACHNQCKLKIYDFDGRRSVWGGDCGRYELTRSKGASRENFFDVRQKIWQGYLEGICEIVQDKPLLEVDGRPTVGMQRALYGHQGAIFWANFFDHLGFRLVITPATNPQISQEGIEATVAETCYPVKVSHGHVKALKGKTAYLFLPTLIDMATPSPEERGFFCPLVQSSGYTVRTALNLSRGNILSPVVHLKRDMDTLAVVLTEQLQSKIKVTRTQVREALARGLEQQARFEKALYEKGQAFLETHNPQEPLIVVTGRPYNLYDERLNLRLGRNLAKIGIAALPMDFIDLSSVDLSDFSSMYWGLGARILRTAKFVQAHPHCFGLHLTNFSCGADSFLEHFFRHIMGAKPYLILELDEHSAVAGVMTRLEAYRNVVENSMMKTRAPTGALLQTGN